MQTMEYEMEMIPVDTEKQQIIYEDHSLFSCGEANFRDFFPCILVQLGDFLRDKVGDFRFGLFF